MQAVTPVTITLPDGVERELRFTLGARKRIYDQFGKSMFEVLRTQGDSALADVLWALLHDRKGKPPEDLDLEELRESMPGNAGNEILAAIMSATSQGQKPKKEIETLLDAAAKLEAERVMRSLTGSGSGVSALSVSESPTEESGGDTSNASLSPESTSTEPSRKSGTTASVR